MQPYAEQRQDEFTLIVGSVQWVGNGKWTDMSLMERKAIVRHLMNLNLALDYPKEVMHESETNPNA